MTKLRFRRVPIFGACLLAMSAASSVAYAETASNAAALTYCESAGGGKYEHIANIAIGDFSHASNNLARYSNFTANTIGLTNDTYSLVLTPGFIGSRYSEFWSVFLDLNADGDFDDDGERLFDGSSQSEIKTELTLSGASLGKTRMRVIMKYNSAVASACESFPNGEVEDYSVFISDGAGNITPTARANGPYRAEIDQAITFDSQGSVDTDGQIVTQLWDFGDGTTLEHNELIQVSHQYAAAGNYPVTLTVTDNMGAHAVSETSAIISNTELPSPDYCEVSGGGDTEWIAAVALGDVNKLSAQDYYSEFTESPINILTGRNTITLTPGFKSSAYTENWSVFIDYNQDGDFVDADELVLTSSSSALTTEEFYIARAAAGITTRMRVAMRYGNPVSNACADISHGEIEDYTLSIAENSDSGLPVGTLEDACATGPVFTESDLADGDAICLQAGRQTFTIPNSDEFDSLAISTSHGSGNLTLFAKNGARPQTDFSDPYSKHVGNDECLIIENPTESWSYIEVNGSHEGSSLVVDFNRLACRVTPGEEEELKSNYGNDGYPYNSVNIKVFRFEFSDVEFDWDSVAMKAEFDKMVQFYAETSYGQFSVSYDMSHPVINMGKPKSTYDDDFHLWKADWQAKILAESGVDPKKPGQQTIVLMTAPKVGSFNSSAAPPSITLYHREGGVIAHELGHALGLRHAYALEGGTEVIGAGVDAATESTNYGGLFSLMGKGSRSYESFDLMHKQYFAWITETDVPLISQSGRYRIYAFDQGDTSGHNAPGIIGLRLKAGAEQDYTYWLEYRTSNQRYQNTRDGVLVYLQGFLETEQDASFWKHKSHLLDMTPDSNTPSEDDWWGNDQIDSELAVGNSYTDKWGAFSIEVLEKGGVIGTADAWIDVKVTIH